MRKSPEPLILVPRKQPNQPRPIPPTHLSWSLHFNLSFTFFGTMRHFSKEFFQKFPVFSKKNVLRFLSLRYSADLGRSCLVGFDIKCRFLGNKPMPSGGKEPSLFHYSYFPNPGTRPLKQPNPSPTHLS